MTSLINNIGLVLLFEFQLLSMGFNTLKANAHAMCYICYQTFKTYFTDHLQVNLSQKRHICTLTDTSIYFRKLY